VKIRGLLTILSGAADFALWRSAARRADASKFSGEKDYYFASFWAVWQINSGLHSRPRKKFCPQTDTG
jgi:hypothetical protein